MRSIRAEQYEVSKQPANVGFYAFAYYFYFKGNGPLKRLVPGKWKS